MPGLVVKDKPIMDAGVVDLVGTQCVIFLPRTSLPSYQQAPARAISKLRALMAAAGRPGILPDVCLSTYGGQYAATHPFAGGNGNALDNDQATALREFTDAADVLCYRALRDDPAFPTQNYGGEAERHGGVIRVDGTHKPAYDVLLGLAKTPEADQLVSALSEIARLKLVIAQARAVLDAGPNP